ncbi:MAG: hypothetical protein HQM10_07135 [Candidatus Riflebacteria bacterium]|nr:hypothetical protein [Candidatus Riflebacteria bacterium]
MSKRHFSIALLFIFISLLSLSAKSTNKYFDIYEQFCGTDSQYKGDRSFLLLKTMPEFEKFWKEHKPSEPMPHFSFDKCMVFFWSSGQNFFDYTPKKAVKFFNRGPASYLVIDLERKLTGGFSQGSYLLVMLQKIPGDIHVLRIGNKDRKESLLMPMHLFSDMGGKDFRFEEIVLSSGKNGKSEKKVKQPKSSSETPASGISVASATKGDFPGGNLFSPAKPEDTLKQKIKNSPPPKIADPASAEKEKKKDDFVDLSF